MTGDLMQFRANVCRWRSDRSRASWVDGLDTVRVDVSSSGGVSGSGAWNRWLRLVRGDMGWLSAGLSHTCSLIFALDWAPVVCALFLVLRFIATLGIAGVIHGSTVSLNFALILGLASALTLALTLALAFALALALNVAFSLLIAILVQAIRIASVAVAGAAALLHWLCRLIVCNVFNANVFNANTGSCCGCRGWRIHLAFGLSALGGSVLACQVVSNFRKNAACSAGRTRSWPLLRVSVKDNAGDMARVKEVGSIQRCARAVSIFGSNESNIGSALVALACDVAARKLTIATENRTEIFFGHTMRNVRDVQSQISARGS
eukprot:m.40952 g.40952  ORF g.40952 m.40952 type:complete len:320 (-) comp10414_c0_seq1:757-1716(-)